MKSGIVELPAWKKNDKTGQGHSPPVMGGVRIFLKQTMNSNYHQWAPVNNKNWTVYTTYSITHRALTL